MQEYGGRETKGAISQDHERQMFIEFDAPTFVETLNHIKVHEKVIIQSC